MAVGSGAFVKIDDTVNSANGFYTLHDFQRLTVVVKYILTVDDRGEHITKHFTIDESPTTLPGLLPLKLPELCPVSCSLIGCRSTLQLNSVETRHIMRFGIADRSRYLTC